MKGRIKSAKIRSGLVSSGELKPLIYMRSQVTIIRQLDESTIESTVLLKCLMGSNYQKETQQTVETFDSKFLKPKCAWKSLVLEILVSRSGVG